MAVARTNIKNKKPPYSAKRGFEIGNNGLPFGEPFGEYWRIPQIQLGPTPEQLITMRRLDGQARSLYRLLTHPLIAALDGATFTAPKGKGGSREAKFVEQALTLPVTAGGMTTSFRKVFAQILLALNDGFSPFELIPYVPTAGPLKGKWIYKKIAHRAPNTITMVVDDNDDFVGFNQVSTHHGQWRDVKIYNDVITRAVYFAAQEEESPYYGRSYFEAAFKHYDKKEKLYYLVHNAAQRAAVGTRVGKHPKSLTNADKLKFERSLANLRSAGWISIRDDYEIESLREVTGWDFLSIINHHNTEMARSILAQFQEDSQGTGGDASLIDFGRQSDKMFILLLRSIVHDVEDFINSKIIPQLVDWNFGSDKYPVFKLGEVTDEQIGQIFDLFGKLATGGQAYLGTPELLRELEKRVSNKLSLDVDYDMIEKDEKKKAEQEEAAILRQQIGAAGQLGGPVTEGLPVPEGFQLSSPEDEQDISLAVRYVKTAAGAAYFGVPVGGAITTDTPGQPAAPAVAGPGAAAQQIGTQPPMPQRELSHPDANGEVVLDFGDGTTALKYSDGAVGPRQNVDIVEWEKLGWGETGHERLGGKGVDPEDVRKQQLGQAAKKKSKDDKSGGQKPDQVRETQKGVKARKIAEKS
jgi:hypothetical protein